jgi:putative flippase GtrA
LLFTARNIILNVVDFFYKPFSKFVDIQTFRYLACGGSNTMLDILIYFLSYNFIIEKQAVYVAGITISPHIAAFLMSFSISFPLGFILSKYIVFPESNLRGRVQLFRYALLVLTCIGLNYVFLKFFVEWCGFFPTPSKAITTALVAIFSYISQRNFTFRVKNAPITVQNTNDYRKQ